MKNSTTREVKKNAEMDVRYRWYPTLEEWVPVAWRVFGGRWHQVDSARSRARLGLSHRQTLPEEATR